MRIINLFVLLLSFGLLMGSCGPKSRGSSLISVSILPQKYFIDELTGGAVEVNVMLSPGASHATYSPTPLQFQKLSDSKLYISIGHLGYEQAWNNRLKELNPEMDVLVLSDKVDLIHGESFHHGDHAHEGGVDSHFWMSPAVIMDLLPVIKATLIRNFPELSNTIESNYPVLFSRVEALHNRMETMSRTLTNRRFLIFHPALTYLARDYGLEQIPIEQEGKEPSPALLAKTIAFAKEKEIPVIFIQKEYDVRNAKLVSEETQTRLVQIDPMAYNWMESMDQIISNLQENLQ